MSYRPEKLVIATHTHTRTHRPTDAGDDNTRWPKLASGKKWKRLAKLETVYLKMSLVSCRTCPQNFKFSRMDPKQTQSFCYIKYIYCSVLFPRKSMLLWWCTKLVILWSLILLLVISLNHSTWQKYLLRRQQTRKHEVISTSGDQTFVYVTGPSFITTLESHVMVMPYILNIYGHENDFIGFTFWILK